MNAKIGHMKQCQKKKKCKCVVHNNTSQQTVGYFLSEPQFLLRFDMSKDATWL